MIINKEVKTILGTWFVPLQAAAETTVFALQAANNQITIFVGVYIIN